MQLRVGRPFVRPTAANRVPVAHAALRVQQRQLEVKLGVVGLVWAQPHPPAPIDDTATKGEYEFAQAVAKSEDCRLAMGY